MATSNTTSIYTATYGRWRIQVDLYSQDQANWRSRFRVRLYMYNNGTSTAFNNNGVSMSINGPGTADWAGSVAFNVSAKAEDLVVDQYFYITHNTDGTLPTTAFTGTLGATGTSTFGNGGTTPSCAVTAPSLATVPGKPSPVAELGILDTSISYSFADNANDGGLDVDDRRLYYSTTNNSATAAFITSTGLGTLGGLDPKTTYYLWGRTHNSVGWSEFSTVSPFKTKDKPEPPTAPNITNILQTTCSYVITDGVDNDAVITSREIAYSIGAAGTKTVFAASSSGTMSPLPPGSELHIWARTHNVFGASEWSPATIITTVAGAYVRDALGTPQKAIPYQNVNGVWKLLEPYVKSNGIWRKTGN